jgi:hypothetical protein
MTMTDRMDNADTFRPLGLDQAQTVGSSEGSKGDGGVAAAAASSVMVERSGSFTVGGRCTLVDSATSLHFRRLILNNSAKRSSQTWIERHRPTSRQAT